MLAVCKRYLRSLEDVEDVMIEGLFKAMTNIDSYSGAGSFEGWIRRIVINEALMHLRKQHNFSKTTEIERVQIEDTEILITHELEGQDILNLLNKLPTGYRTVFNLYVIEGYKHKEIAEILGISINTSKSQLILAKNRLRQLLLKHEYVSRAGQF
jgi:RNA polymerase sigma factor, sigma-70 family